MDSVRQDLRFALRMIAGSPGFSTVAVAVLALGIGANTTIFTLLNAMLLRPIEAHAPEELVAIYSRDTSRPDVYRPFSYPNYRDIRAFDDVFANVMAHDLTTTGVGDGEISRRILTEIVSSNYFETFGVTPFRGRFFTPEEEVPGSAVPLAIVSHELWRKRGADPDLVGSTLRVNGRELTIVGIAPRGFTGRTALLSTQLFLPFGMHHLMLSDMFVTDSSTSLTDRAAHRLLLVGRLRSGLDPVEAESRLTTLTARMRERHPEINADQALVVGSLERLSVGTSPDDDGGLQFLAVLLLSMTGIVLLIACLNLANMLLARGAARRREFAIRAAIGGGRARLLRQLLTEAMTLALLGGATGMAIAVWVNRLLSASLDRVLSTSGFSMDIVLRSTPDLRVVLATGGFCVAGTLMFGLGPALRQSRPDVVEQLKSRDVPAAGRVRRSGRRGLLVVTQLALSVVLLVAAGLFMRGASAAARVDPGFPLAGGLLVELDPGLAGYDEARTKETYRRVVDRLRALPEIERVSLAATVPFGSVSAGRRVRRAEDLPGAGAAGEETIETVGATSNIVTDDYFATLGIPLRAGREFSREEAEFDTGPPVAIVDETLAALLWPDQNPIGRQIGFGRERSGPDMEIVGVVGTVRDDLFPAELRPHVYVPYGQSFQTGMLIHLRTVNESENAAAAALRAAREEIRAVDDRLPIVRLRTLAGHLGDNTSIWVVRMGATIFSAFGCIALFLAVIGVYAVKAYTVARRTREIGIRKSLGATSGATLGLVLREGLGTTAIGLTVGLALAAAVARLLASALYEVSAFDPLVFVSAPAVLAAASLLATLIPARRAARVAPIIALRQE